MLETLLNLKLVSHANVMYQIKMNSVCQTLSINQIQFAIKAFKSLQPNCNWYLNNS